MSKIGWNKKHILKIGNEPEYPEYEDAIPDDKVKGLRKKIEPWLTAIFQSEHLSLLAGSGLTSAVLSIAESQSQGMGRIEFNEFKDEIKIAADIQAEEMCRGVANFEDDLRVAIELYKGLLIQKSNKAGALKKELDEQLLKFISNILKTENKFIESKSFQNALLDLKSFLISFASRTSSRDRLHIFTTNYDRFIEYACDKAGILVLDRFIGKIEPIFRTNKLELDYHYNPPGIRGEPRYVEGVTRYTKLHGSLDWCFDRNDVIRASLPFGADKEHPAIPKEPFEHVVIYPNSSKGIETAFYPYSELFRDFSSAICRPNSIIVIYGYGFGDSHINRVLNDMLTIPSTHIAIISWDNAGGKLQRFVEQCNLSQFTLLIGSHFGDLRTLVDHYLPKAAIDRITERKRLILEKRGELEPPENPKPEET